MTSHTRRGCRGCRPTRESRCIARGPLHQTRHNAAAKLLADPHPPSSLAALASWPGPQAVGAGELGGRRRLCGPAPHAGLQALPRLRQRGHEAGPAPVQQGQVRDVQDLLLLAVPQGGRGCRVLVARANSGSEHLCATRSRIQAVLKQQYRKFDRIERGAPVSCGVRPGHPRLPLRECLALLDTLVILSLAFMHDQAGHPQLRPLQRGDLPMLQQALPGLPRLMAAAAASSAKPGKLEHGGRRWESQGMGLEGVPFCHSNAWKLMKQSISA